MSNAKHYSDVFENTKSGQIVLDELIAKFGNNPYVKGGQEGARQTDFNSGSLEVINFILRKIEAANRPEESNDAT